MLALRKRCEVVLGATILAAAGVGGSVVAEELPKPHPDLPEEFRQLLTRGEIPAVDDPVFVPAAEAELPDDAWVLGVAVGGQARAYSLNLLNHHEVVNDRVGKHNIAAVW